MYFILHVSGVRDVSGATLRRNNVLCRFCVQCAVCPGAVCPLSVCRNLKNWNATSDDCKWRREALHILLCRPLKLCAVLFCFFADGTMVLAANTLSLGLRADETSETNNKNGQIAARFILEFKFSNSIPIHFCGIDEEKMHEIWMNGRFKCKRDASMIECAFRRIRGSNACETVFTLGPITAEKRHQRYLRWGRCSIDSIHAKASKRKYKKFGTEF